MSEKNMLEVVRIKDPSGVERNATRAEAKRINATVLDKPIRDAHDRPVPAQPNRSKPRTDLAGQPSGSSKSADDKKKEA